MDTESVNFTLNLEARKRSHVKGLRPVVKKGKMPKCGYLDNLLAISKKYSAAVNALLTVLDKIHEILSDK